MSASRRAITQEVLGCTTQDRLFATSRFHFAYAIGNSFAALRMGCGNVLLERWATGDGRRDHGALQADGSAQRAGGLSSAPGGGAAADARRFAACASFVSAGERLPPQIWNAWEQASGHPDPRRARLLGAGLHGDRQHAHAAQARLVRLRDAGRRASHRRRRWRA